VAQARLEEFAVGPWGQRYPVVVASWTRNWEQVIPFFAYPPEVRKIIYTTNAIESLHSQVRKAVSSRGHFPSDEAATKLIWLVLRNVAALRKNPPIAWHAAKTQMALMVGDRFIMSA
jgi:transposase-like protein